jgi:ribosomal protein S18 acetylase RimI-like enzyme
MNADVMEIRPMSGCGESVRREAALVFVDGFYRELSFLSPDRDRLADAFAPMINPDAFWLAVRNGAVVGILACSDRTKQAIRLDRERMRKSFGLLKSSIAYRVMKGEFVKGKWYPEGTGYIECVATSSAARRQGVASALLRFVLQHAPYRRYALDLMDTNTEARRLYDKMGFVESKRVREPFGRIKGFKERVFMEWPGGKYDWK